MSLILYGVDQMQGKPDHWLIIIAGAAFLMFAIANIYVRD